MKLVVTGASGYVARNFRKHTAKNARLVSISRSKHKTFEDEVGITISTGNNYTKKHIIKEVNDADALIHLIGIGRQSVNISYDNVNVQLAYNAIDMCKKARIKKIVYVSGLGASPNTPLAYFISKFKAERAIIESGLNYTIFRASYIVGRGDALTKYIKKQMGPDKKGIITIPGRCFAMQPIHIDDVSKVILRSVKQSKFKNKIIDLVGPESITLQQYVRGVAGKDAEIKTISLEQAYHTAITNPSTTYFGVDDLGILAGNFYGEHSRLQKISKMKFRPIMTELR